jgi:DNA helicase II / ATP-dependent DNA helicase PcrA
MTSRIGQPDTETDVALRGRLIADGNRHFIVVAGAGSGKTTSLVKALAFVANSQGTRLRRMGQKIACITYTEVAVREILDDVGTDSLYHVSTIHSFLWEAIKPFQNDLREWVRGRLNEKIQENEDKINNVRTQQRTKDRALEENDRYRHQLQQVDQIRGFRYGTGSDYTHGVLGHSDILKIGPDFVREHALMKRIITRRYPVVFVDESQDTDPNFVAALRTVAEEVYEDFCIGFFGDPVQKIYMQGAGAIPIGRGWEKFEKPENFRCSQSVLRVINRIRAEDDGLQQTRGRLEERDGALVPVEGTARVLVMPDDERRPERLNEARHWLAAQDADEDWLADEDEETLRLVVLVHRVAADRLGFPNLYSALNDKSTETLSSGVVDGTAWVLKPILSFLLPLITAHREGRSFDVMRLLRKHCPKLQDEALVGANTAAILNTLQEDIAVLDGMLEDGEATIGTVISCVREAGLYDLDERYLDLVEEYQDAAQVTDPAPENAPLRFMQCAAQEVWGYRQYIEKLSPFATQHGVKGAEFRKVLVVIDDKEGQLPGFSYGKYLGLTPLSERDEANISAGRESVVDRTRRLFYVCCSRALSDLAVAVFTDDTARVERALIQRGFFDTDQITVLP